MAGGRSAVPGHARAAINDHSKQVFVSAASAWEIATKVRLGKLPGAAAIVGDLSGVILHQGFQPLSVAIEHGERAGALPGPLKDPFDRMLIAQAMLDELQIVSIERTFDAYGVAQVW